MCKETKTAPAHIIGTHTDKPNIDLVTQAFIAAQLSNKSELPEGNNAENELQDFIFVAQNIAQNFGNNRTWDFRDFLLYAEHLDTNRDILKQNFDSYVSFLKQSGLVNEIAGCYNQSVFLYV